MASVNISRQSSRRVVCAIAVAGVLALAACTPGQGSLDAATSSAAGATSTGAKASATSTAGNDTLAEPSTPIQSAGATPADTSKSGAVPSTAPDAAALALKPKVEAALTQLAASSPKPSTDQMRTAMGTAGLAANDIEVSIGKTPTGLDVDSIQAAGKVNADCVFGQIRNGKVSMSILPVLGDGKCFIGDQR